MGQETTKAVTVEAEARMEWLEEELAKERNQHRKTTERVEELLRRIHQQDNCIMELKALLYDYIADRGGMLEV